MSNSRENSAQRVWDRDAAHDEAWGSSQIGPFDFVPRLGFREYWYPALWKKEVGPKKPVYVRMLGDDIAFFRGANGSVAALSDWCPHRNARLSLGVSEFPGTITCPYHGYTFDGTGQCVAGLIDHPTSPVINKMRARSYPTSEHQGIIYIWMGETDPVPLEEDLPDELANPRVHKFVRVKVWDTNWTEPIAQGVDFHEGYLHRMQFKLLPMYPKEPLWARWLMNTSRVANKQLGFFRPKIAYYGGVEIVHEADNFIATKAKAPVFGQAFHAGVQAKWPAHIWWRRLGLPKRRAQMMSVTGVSPSESNTNTRGTRGSLLTGKAFDHSVELPSKIRSVVMPESVHLRWMVPVTSDTTRVWTYTMCLNPSTVTGRLWQNVWYYLWRKPSIIVSTNEQEDLATFMKDRLRFDLPQKLGPLDVGLIYFRRHLARRSRDFKRLGGAKGTDKGLPTRTADEWRRSQTMEAQKPAAETAAG